MACPSIGILEQPMVFDVQTFSGGNYPVDADALPTWRLYESGSDTPMLTGTMEKYDDSNTTGFYKESVNIYSANGFEAWKTYTVRIICEVGGVSVARAYSFICLSPTDAQRYVDGSSGNAEVLAIVKERLGRTDLTTVTTELRAALKEITGRVDILPAVTTVTLTIGDDDIDLPTDYKSLRHIVCRDTSEADDYGHYDEWPLTENLTDDYHSRGVVDPGEPESYCVDGNELLLDVPADAAYEIDINYWRYHPDDVTTVLLPSEYREAFYCLTTAKVCAGKDLDGVVSNVTRKWFDLYEREMAMLAPHQRRESRIARYRDI